MTEPRVLEWGIAAEPRTGEAASGDRAVVIPSQATALVGAADGLGHGPEAPRAAEAAVTVLRDFASDDVVSLMERCHEALKPTRGAALALASFRFADAAMTWLGVGDVAGRLVRGGHPHETRVESLRLSAGLPGQQLPILEPATLDVARGDTLILATDGIDAAFADSLVLTGSADEIAARVLRRSRRDTDDALVVAVRYLGGAP